MPADRQTDNNLDSLLAALLILTVFFAQYVFRDADNNRLTSWLWTFEGVNLIQFAALLVLGIIVAFALSKTSLPAQRPAVFLFITSFACCCVFWGEPEVIVDTSRYFTHAKHLEMYGMNYFLREWGKGINAWTDMPLVSFFYGLIFKFIGEARIYIQIFTALLFSATVALVFFIGKAVGDKETGFIGGILLLGIPYLYSQIPLMLTDVPTMFFLTLSIFTFIKAMEKGGRWIIISSAAIFCAVFSKYSTWIMLSVLPVIFTVYLINRRGNPLRLSTGRAGTEACPDTFICRFIAVCFLAGLLIAIVAFLKYDVMLQQIKFLREYQEPGLKRWGESFVSTFLFQIHPLITLSALFSIYEAFRKRDLKFLVICWLMLLVVLLQIKRSRYVMVTFPMLTLMASYGLQKIRMAETRRFIAYSVVSSALAVAVLSYLPFLQKMSMTNLKDAGKFLDSVKAEKVEVFTIPSAETIVNLAVSVPILDVYTKKEILYHHDSAYSPPFEEIKISPLRFTWEFKNPRYYESPSLEKGGKGGFYEQNHALVIITNGNLKSLPDNITGTLKGYRETMVFDTTEGIFGFNPFVAVYQRE